MALQVLRPEKPYPTAGARLGEAVGQGVGSGISSLVTNKLAQLKQDADIKKLTQSLVTSGVDERDAQLMARIAVTNPQHFHNVWSQLSPRQAQESQEIGQEAGGMEEMPQQQDENEQYLQSPELMQQMNLQKLLSNIGKMNQQPGVLQGLGGGDLAQENALNQLLKAAGVQPNFPGAMQELAYPKPKPKPQPSPTRPTLQAQPEKRASIFGGGAVGTSGKPLTESERIKREVRDDELVSKRNDIRNYIDIAKEMKRDLESGEVQLGGKSALLGSNEFTGYLLGDATGRFNKNAAELINYRTDKLKGQQSKYRQQNIVKGKPGLGQTENVNLGILNRYIDDGESMLEIFDADHPDIAKKFSERKTEESDHMPYGPAYEENGQYFLWSDEVNDYVPAKMKGK